MASADTVVLDDDMNPLEPGTGTVGRLARGGNIPLGYYNDPERSALVFFEHEGKRYSIPGDFATIEEDGQVTLLGRGSIMINTGGEKVFPEEVEEAVKAHPAVDDCLVVGVADDRFGERIVAVAALRPGQRASEADILAVAGEHVARYKLPKQLVIVERVRRAANGKADYPWARETAASAS
jgi:acyl-CoA synthetase (AMP-forming)/AMP-acid ligase II